MNRAQPITLNEALAMWVASVPVPVTVNVALAQAALNAKVKVRIEVPPATTLDGLKLPVTPHGSPDTDRSMVCAEPAVTAVLTVYDTFVLVNTSCDGGLTEMLKSFARTDSSLLAVTSENSLVECTSIAHAAMDRARRPETPVIDRRI